MKEKSKNDTVNVLYRQLLTIKGDWENLQKNQRVIFEAEIYHYNSLIKKAASEIGNESILSYCISNDGLTSSAKGNKLIFPDAPLFQVKNLLRELEVTHKISFPEVSFIQEEFLRDKYQLFLFDRKNNTSGDVLLSVTTELESRLRKKAELPLSCTGVDLANKALDPKTGRLTLKGREDKEMNGYYHLMKGYFDFVRGKPHHERSTMGRRELYQRIIVTDLLFKELDNLILKKKYGSVTTQPNSD